MNNPTRKELYEMTTQQIYSLASKCTKIQNKIKAELILRGDY